MTTLLEKLKQRKEAQAAKRAQGINVTRLKEGKNLVRILPNWEGDKDGAFYHDFGVHYIKVPGSTKPDSVYMCYDKTYGRECPVCEAIREGIRSTQDDDLIKVLKDSFATGRVLVNALMLDSQDPHTPVVLELPTKMFEDDIVNGIIAAAEEGDDLLDLQHGANFTIERTGKGMDTKYSAVASRKSSSVPKEVMSKVVNLADFVNQKNETIEKKALLSVRKAIGGSSAAALIGGSSLLEEDAVVRTGTDDQPVSTTTTRTNAVEQAIVDAEFTEVPANSSGGDDIDNLLAELDNL